MNFLKGIGIGIANVIPGVSGGTMAVVFGIYDKLIECIANFLQASMKKKMEYVKFMLPLLLGCAVGILFFANVIGYLYENYPVYTKGVFVILVLPSIPIIIKGENIKDIKNILSFSFGLLFVVAFFMFTHDLEGNTFTKQEFFTFTYGLKLALCGALAGGAMIIPGISGSLLLLALGEHENVINYIGNIEIIPLLYFGIGVGIGILIFTKIINYFLQNYRSKTLFVILGIVIASLIELLINI
ncbi:MAG: DUF368 domain-containing protein [Fusobacterium perfoetens]|nr:DUF368 domain-containing protein [Fusobacterium perfoetens]MCI6151542.1 DUF368 domain-containing protein [Fusobacterium perfoetens]